MITPPQTEPVTLAEAKAHLREDATDADTLKKITDLIKSAREYCEGFQNRAYVTQSQELVLDTWPSGKEIIIPRPPLQSVESIKYKDKDGLESTWDPVNYIVDPDSAPGRVILGYQKAWPSVELQPAAAIRARFVSGYLPTGEGETADPAGNVPQVVKQAMLLLIGHWYEHREAVVTGTISKEIELAVDALLWPDRVMPV